MIADLAFPTPTSVILPGIVLLILGYGVALTRRQWTDQPISWPVWDIFSGIDFFLPHLDAYRNGGLLSSVGVCFDKIQRKTFSVPLGGDQIILTIEPDNVQYVLKEKFNSFSLGERKLKAFVPFAGEGVFTTEGPEWHRSRVMINHSLRENRQQSLQSLELHTQRFISMIPKDGAALDLQPLFGRLTLDTISEFLFGERIGCLDAGENPGMRQFEEAFARGQARTAEIFNWGAFSKFMNKSQYKLDTTYVHNYVDTLVEAALNRLQASQSIDSNPVMDPGDNWLLQVIERYQDHTLARGEVLQIMMAGRDTTASLLTNLWWELSRNPNIYDELRTEVESLESQTPSSADLGKLRLLRAALSETLRLYPPVPINTREALQDEILPRGGGHDESGPILISRGTILAWDLRNMQRRPDIFGDAPHTFNPHRWERISPGWAFLPFNGGPRACPGQFRALDEAAYVTFRMLQTFSKVESQSTEPWIEQLTLTCANRTGCRVALFV